MINKGKSLYVKDILRPADKSIQDFIEQNENFNSIKKQIQELDSISSFFEKDTKRHRQNKGGNKTSKTRERLYNSTENLKYFN